VEDATEMAYWPQFQHKTGQFLGFAGAFGDNDGGGLAVTMCRPILWPVATAAEACNQVEDGTIRP